jgi:hypothetical protein
VLSHVPHVLVYAGLCSLPLLIWLPLALFADDSPRNSDEPPDTGEEPELLPLAA